MRPVQRLCALACLLAAGAWAQGTTPIGTEQLAAERARIAGERSRITERFVQEERACHQRFAVTDCLNRNLEWQRAALADLRRQEILLNDSERQRRAAERMDRLDEKTQSRAAEQAARPHAEQRQPNAPSGPVGGKLPQAGEPAPRVPDQAAIRQHQQRMERKNERHAEAEGRRADQAAQADDTARRQGARVREAEARKARIVERNASEPSKAGSLPDPAATPTP
ncbi:hypothetical protein [Pseudorhodoferax sp.]|uniref:hypothetical protein n=1 Tax=Pseudorhodoferax sp. TaxID=1993553 RepID=UPI002DD69210|nr:hypothetical protein [Pseudorhodoferax sp.]